MNLPGHNDTPGAVQALVRDANVEIIPLKSAYETFRVVPTGTTITVTSSAKLGLERTLDFSTVAAKAGYRVVPHLAARLVKDAPALKQFVGRLDEAGITDLYVIAGDAPEPAGDYTSAVELLEALSEIEHGITSIGVACYPEGHPSISDDVLSDALRRKQPHADYMVSQLCFDDTAIATWLRGVREDGITLPLHLGLAAPMQIRKLAELSMKIGVGSSVRYLTKQHGFVGNLLRGRSYRPEGLIEELGSVISFSELNIDSLHLFSLNQIAETVDWQAKTAGTVPVAASQPAAPRRAA